MLVHQRVTTRLSLYLSKTSGHGHQPCDPSEASEDQSLEWWPSHSDDVLSCDQRSLTVNAIFDVLRCVPGRQFFRKKKRTFEAFFWIEIDRTIWNISPSRLSGGVGCPHWNMNSCEFMWIHLSTPWETPEFNAHPICGSGRLDLALFWGPLWHLSFAWG